MTALRDAGWLAERVVLNPETGCMEWTKSRTASGYGEFSAKVNGIRVHGLANRLALELKLGRSLHPGMCALHHCDNPPCCNADHLFEGTRGDNNRDRDAKGRTVVLRGEAVGTSKLNRAEVDEIRAGLHVGLTGRSLAQHYGVTPQLISLIKHGKAWK